MMLGSAAMLMRDHFRQELQAQLPSASFGHSISVKPA